MNDEITFFCDAEGTRLDLYLSEAMDDMSRSYIQKLIAENKVLVNGLPVKAGYRTREGDGITVTVPETKKYEAVPQDIPVEILFEDDDIIVVNKERGMVVHPAPGNYDGTLVNALLHHCKGRLSSINGVERPGIVHRIDKDTSGILVVAKTDAAHRELGRMFSVHDIAREYLALVKGVVSENGARIDAPIGRHTVDRKKMSVNTRNGKRAVTGFTVVERYRNATMIRARLETGRTHQIRVHMAYIGHPVIGDAVYGKAGREHSISGQALHAAKLGFYHPVTGIYMEFEKEPPWDFMELVRELENE
ncbi:MAG: RluA family pseudouridine synthase [Clostridia bacterium]|nr:RluA family pseudouridine synthase [Clostridia bacterium]